MRRREGSPGISPSPEALAGRFWKGGRGLRVTDKPQGGVREMTQHKVTSHGRGKGRLTGGGGGGEGGMDHLT